MTLDHLLQGLAASLNLDTLQPETDGSYQLVVDGRLNLRIIPEGARRCLLTGTIAHFDADEESSVRALLLENMGRIGDGRHVLAFDAAEREVILFHRLRIDDLDTDAFAYSIEVFLDRLEAWVGVANQHENPFHPREDMAMPVAMLFP